MNAQAEQKYQNFKNQLDQIQSSEEKVRLALQFMKESLAESDTFRLKTFWDAKNDCIEAFKLKMNPFVRKTLWAEYTDLIEQAKKLKQVLDEQSNFSIEQIDMALTAVESELQSIDENTKTGIHFQIPAKLNHDLKHREIYQKNYAALTLYSVLATRLTALRKEILNTEMRIKHKNKLLKRLSSLGDQVFPKKKELVEVVSQAFAEDVTSFTKELMESKLQPFLLKDKIKLLQKLAKEFHLSNAAFKTTRELLTQAWDQIRDLEKQHRLEKSDQLKEQEQNFEEWKKKIEPFVQNPTTIAEGNQLLKELANVSLRRTDQKTLRTQLQDAIKTLKQAAEEEKQKQQKEQKQKLDQLISELGKSNDLKFEELKSKERHVFEEFEKLATSDLDRYQLEQTLLEIKVSIILKQLEQDEDQHADLEFLRDEIKEAQEKFRKEAGGSGLDFERSMALSELMDQNKKLLEEINQYI